MTTGREGHNVRAAPGVTTIRDMGNHLEAILHQEPKTLLEDRS